MDDRIPLHIIGYMPVPGMPWRRPTVEEMRRAALRAKRHLRSVSWSLPSIEEISYLSIRLLLIKRKFLF
ncbi:MAG: hypothetical protein ACTSXJ_10625 [Candidatus Baldrarchaeia archaeon]